MDIRKIKKLIELIEETDILEIEIKEGEESLKLSRRNTVMDVPIQRSVPQTVIHQPIITSQQSIAMEENKAQTPMLASGYKIRSPMVGTMYTSPSPEAAPFVVV